MPSGTYHLNYSPDGDLVENTGTDGGRYVGKFVRLSETTSDWYARIIVNGTVVAVVASVSGTVSTHYLIQDALGSTAAITNADGSQSTRVAYNAWGKLVSATDGTTQIDATAVAAITTVGYTGQEMLAEANLIQMGARIYDPDSGVFLSPDPTNAQPDDPRDWNQYAYVYDNPMTYVDPSGYAVDGTPLGTVNVPWCVIHSCRSLVSRQAGRVFHACRSGEAGRRTLC